MQLDPPISRVRAGAWSQLASFQDHKPGNGSDPPEMATINYRKQFERALEPRLTSWRVVPAPVRMRKDCLGRHRKERMNHSRCRYRLSCPHHVGMDETSVQRMDGWRKEESRRDANCGKMGLLVLSEETQLWSAGTEVAVTQKVDGAHIAPPLFSSVEERKRQTFVRRRSKDGKIYRSALCPRRIGRCSALS